jgi:hypothetical protein
MNSLLKLRRFAIRRGNDFLAAADGVQPGSPARIAFVSKAVAFNTVVQHIDRTLKSQHDRRHDRRKRSGS